MAITTTIVSAGMVSALTLVAAWAGPLAIAFAIIGIVILIVYILTRSRQLNLLYTEPELQLTTCHLEPENPIQDFIDKRVKPAGLYMDHLAIDYFNAIAATDKTASRIGVSIQGASAGTSPASPDERVYLMLDATDAKTASLKYTKDLDFTTATVWSLQTDGHGRSQFYTQKYFEIKGEDGSTSRRPSLWYLSVSENATGVCVRKLPSRTTDKANHDMQVGFTQWTVDVVADPDLDATSKTPVRALCDVSYKTSSGVVKHLVLQSEPSKKTPTKLALVTDPKNTSTARDINKWLVQAESLGPQNFRYSRNPWNLLLTDTVHCPKPEPQPS